MARGFCLRCFNRKPSTRLFVSTDSFDPDIVSASTAAGQAESKRGHVFDHSSTSHYIAVGASADAPWTLLLKTEDKN